MNTLTFTTPAGQRIEFDCNDGHCTEVRTVFGQFTRKTPAVMGHTGTWILFKSERAAWGYLSSIGLEDTVGPEVGPTWRQDSGRRAVRVTDLLKAVDDDPVPAPAPARGGPWQQAYTVAPDQDEHGRWAFHVYHRHAGRLTVCGYERASMAERVAEMRHKLGLDEPNSVGRRYLAHHFNDTLRALEG